MVKSPRLLRLSTFSIVGFDPNTGDLGIAVASKYLAVGAVVPWARAGAGAIATQAFANTSFGPRGLSLLHAGLSAEEVLARLIQEDSGAEERQVGIVDARGRSAAYTGSCTQPWSGHYIGKGFSVQGNLLVGPEVLSAMVEAFQKEEGSLAYRLLQALSAGQRAGGDRRGQQSSALLVVREGRGYAGWNDRYIDLRVDDHPSPVEELCRLYSLHRETFGSE